jgi:N-acetylmuramoyl-L-alanine amidase
MCLLLLAAQSAAAASIQAVRMQKTSDTTRLVFDVSEPVGFRVFSLDSPRRVVVDFTAARPRAGLSLASVPLTGTPVTAIRGGPLEGAGYRIVLDVSAPLEPKGTQLAPSGDSGNRIVVDLAPVTTAAAAAPVVSAPSAPRTAVSATGGQLRDFVVAVDAGHGGQDPGAIGVGKIQEKRVALAIAEQLARLIDAKPGYRAVLVRRGDYYLTLRQRTEVARRQRADLFVSVHADMFSRAAARGASVYTLSSKGATSETARWLAEKENASDLIGGVGDVSLDDKDALLAHVLLDLSMDANRSASIEAGASVLSALRGVTSLHRNRVEQAGFVVLKSPDIPSILVETGYLSNAAEARALAQPAYQRKIAQAIFTGITNHVAKHAPPDTRVASQRSVSRITGDAATQRAVSRKAANNSTEHVIKRGDTLLELAAHYQVSPVRLRQVNGLANDMIHVGQVLIIPPS